MSQAGVQPTDSVVRAKRSSKSRVIPPCRRSTSRKGSQRVSSAMFSFLLFFFFFVSRDPGVSNPDRARAKSRSRGLFPLDRWRGGVLGSAPPMITGSIARRYAKALFALAEEKGRVEPWLESLSALEKVVAGSADLGDALSNLVYPREERRGVADELARALGLDEEPRHLLLLLADRGRLESLLGVVDHFRALADRKLGRVRARVVSAVPLAEASAREIAARLAQAARAEVILDQAVDPFILGGVIAQVGSLTYDGSVRSQLEELRRSLTR